MAGLHLGLDIGSTTVKLVLLDGTETVRTVYRRHHTDVHAEVARLLAELSEDFPKPLRSRL